MLLQLVGPELKQLEDIGSSDIRGQRAGATVLLILPRGVFFGVQVVE